MLAKETFINTLHSASYEHKKWLNSVKTIVSGLSNDDQNIPLNETDTPFGTWLHRDAIVFSMHNSKLVLEDISSMYTQCYELFIKIYELLIMDKKGSFLQSLFTKRASNSEIILAQKYYEELVVLSDNLMKRVRLFETQMHATSPDKFEQLFPQVITNMSTTENTQDDTSKVQRYYRGTLIED